MMWAALIATNMEIMSLIELFLLLCQKKRKGWTGITTQANVNFFFCDVEESETNIFREM